MDLQKFRHKAVSRFVEACREGNLKAAQSVLEHKRTPAAPEIVSGYCPITNMAGLHAAALMGRLHIVRWLCDNMDEFELDVNQPCANPRLHATPIHYAARAGRHDTIEFLLVAGADKHRKDKFNREPVDWAIEQRRDDVEYLFRDKCSEPRGLYFDKERTTPNEIYVTWKPPSDLGGLPLLGYKVYVRRMRAYEPPTDNTLEGRAKEEERLRKLRELEDYSHPNPGDEGYKGVCEQRMVEVGPNINEAICKGLIPANVYIVCVSAVSLLGDGAPTEWLEMMTAPTVPSPPPPPFVVATTCKSILCGWNVPSHINGRRITLYEITKRRATGGPFKTFATVAATSRSAREALLKDLEPGDGFRFKVRAKNAVGFSQWSRESRVMRTNTGAAMVTRSDRTIRITWIAPFIGRARYSGKYEIQQKRVLSRKEIVRLAHLENTRQISGVTEEQRGNWTAADIGSRERLSADKSSAFSDVEMSKLPKYLSGIHRGDKLEDLKSSDDEDGPCHFENEVEDSDEENESLQNGLIATMAKPEALVVGLIPNTKYRFRLRADVDNPTPWSLAIESNDLTTEVGVPEPPLSLVQTCVTHDSAWISWRRPHNNGLPVEAFQILVRAEESKAQDDDSEFTVHVPIVDFRSNMPPTRSGIIGKLKPGRRYFFAVQAYNECGWGPSCPKLLISTRSIHRPDPPWTVEDVMGADTFVLLRWKPFGCSSSVGDKTADTTNNITVDQYRIQFSDDYEPLEHSGPHQYPGTWTDANTTKGCVSGSDTEMIVRDGLKAVHRYYFRIAARNAYDGCWSIYSKPSRPWTSQRRW